MEKNVKQNFWMKKKIGRFFWATLYVISHILYYNFNNPLFDSDFPSKLKEANITPFYKCIFWNNIM